ncbi:procathepsin L-like isoform X1 [Mya arenaria]|uniref:procathepsin L-like isoform X1 n=1 Tax=Mya arenaria TaxID=6604 RepID=UPI0022E21165|nr:procathepsin L-like isoform X1 [Mya arenaria]
MKMMLVLNLVVVLLTFQVELNGASGPDIGINKTTSEINLGAIFEEFKQDYGKQYANASEEARRRAIFADNVEYVNAHNFQFALGKMSYYMGVNQFSDMTFEEWASLYTSRMIDDVGNGNASTFLTPENFRAPGSVDWRQKGYVTSVKSQGACGSCWSFSATGAIEGQHFRKTGKLISLSEQQLVDCSRSYGNKGCGGGFKDQAMLYVKDAGGIESEKVYPYTDSSKVFSCRFTKSMAVATVTGVKKVDSTESSLMDAVASQGPIAVSIKVNKKFKNYAGGIFYDSSCISAEAGHAVLAVGYGSTPGEYWLVKNSWGPRWGEKGYIRMARNKGNVCGIARKPVFPTV